jgi:diguanylate cyclase (GGDEF)-like protein
MVQREAAPPVDSNAEPGARDAVGYRDDLTGLPGRPLMREHLELALARARLGDKRVALLHVGLDDFQLVNDSLGHACGDDALRQTAKRLADLTGPAGVVARAGGDAFCVLLADQGANAEDVAQIVAGQIRSSFEEPFCVADREFQLTASTGASIFPKDADDEEALLRHAEAAMRSAKRLGRGAFVCYSGDTMESLERLLMTSRLRRALDRDELVLHYQPIFSLPNLRPTGVEALIRWKDPDRGLIPPAQFIPIAEYTGLIEPIGRWVIRRVCEQAAAWRAEGIDAQISFNTSPHELRDPGFPSALTDALAKNDLDAGAVAVEITESAAMEGPERVESILSELRRAGVAIGIDDFGTGYSSLSRLRSMPVEVLKLDRVFLDRAPDETRIGRMASAVLELIRALGMTAIAEGVETEAQLRFLVERECPLAQGFYLARPMPSEDAREVIRTA